MISFQKNYIFIILVDLYASLSRFFLVPGSRSTFPDADPDPDPAKWYGSDRIRNTDFRDKKDDAKIKEKGEEATKKRELQVTVESMKVHLGEKKRQRVCLVWDKGLRITAD